ncbi:MAG: hypothetical protein V4650_09420 [Pseudomonadota bacterium]
MTQSPAAVPLPTAEQFESARAQAFKVHLGAQVVTLLLDKIEPRRGSGRGMSFAVTFRGPADWPLEPDTHELEHPVLGLLMLFISPFAERDGERHYEAIFN